MFIKKITSNLNEHIKNNFWLYMTSLLCICVGAVIGIYTVRYMGNFEKNDLLNYLVNFSNSITADSVKYKTVLFETIKNNIPIILAIWFLGLTIIGIPVILIIDGIKGFTLGFTISFIIKGLGIKGITLVLLGILPQNIIYIPIVIISSVVAMEFSIMMLKDKVNKQWTINVSTKVATYSGAFLFMSLIMFIGFLTEAYLTPNLVKLVLNNMGILII